MCKCRKRNNRVLNCWIHCEQPLNLRSMNLINLQYLLELKNNCTQLWDAIGMQYPCSCTTRDSRTDSWSLQAYILLSPSNGYNKIINTPQNLEYIIIIPFIALIICLCLLHIHYISVENANYWSELNVHYIDILIGSWLYRGRKEKQGGAVGVKEKFVYIGASDFRPPQTRCWTFA